MSQSMIEALTTELVRSGAVGQMVAEVGADESAVGDAMSAALPMLITALARNASTPEGARSLSGALAEDHDGTVLDDLVGFIGQGGDPRDGEAILGHVFGDRRDVVERGLSQGTGVEKSLIGELLPLLAPIVLEYLGRQQRKESFGPEDLAGYLQREQQEMVRKAPDDANLGALASILDMDKDGSLGDDAARIGSGLLKAFLQRRGG